jgi:hypothetical protein
MIASRACSGSPYAVGCVAKKANTPRPPVQAPKRRDTKSGGGLSSAPRWAIVVGVLVVAGVVAAVVLATSGGGGSSSTNTSGVKAAMVAAGCTYRDVKPYPPKNKANYHADSPTLSSKVRWSTFPPSAGGHYGLWAVWGFFRAPVNPRRVVHNLEHGGVVIWWGPNVPSSTVDQLEAFYRQSPNAMFGTPIAGLGNKVALTAWTGNPTTYYRNGDFGIGHIAVCPGYDAKAFAAFRSAFRGKGPEGIPVSSNTPGSGPQ